MEEKKIKEVVYNHLKSGYHCAETVLSTIQGIFPVEGDFSCKVASGFCGGIGECKQDICGALSGGIMALGTIYGRDKGGDDINKLIFLSSELRQSFLDEFKSTICHKVIENIENRKEEYKGCQDVTAKATILLHNIIKNNQ